MGLKRTDEFRQDAVRIALTSGLTRKEVACGQNAEPISGISRISSLGLSYCKNSHLRENDEKHFYDAVKQHLMTIIRLISLVPMLGDKVPFKFSLTAVVGFAIQQYPPVYDKVKRETLHPVRRVR